MLVRRQVPKALILMGLRAVFVLRIMPVGVLVFYNADIVLVNNSNDVALQVIYITINNSGIPDNCRLPLVVFTVLLAHNLCPAQVVPGGVRPHRATRITKQGSAVPSPSLME